MCPGSLHRISVWIRRPSLETGCKMSLRVDNGVLLDVDSDITLTTTDWFSISGTFTPAAGSGPTQNVNLEMNCVSLVSANVGASRVMYADDLTVVVLESSLPA